MTDTNTLAPTDAELMQVIKDVAKNSAINRDGSTSLRIARAVLAKWGAPAPASSEAHPVAATSGMWAIFDSQGFYEVRGTEADAKGFCDHYNKRPVDPLKPYRFEPIFTAAQVQAMLAQGLAPGRQAVPVEDTPSMWTAGGRAIKNCGGHDRDAASLAYKAMLAAAPSGPAQEPQRCSCHACWPIAGTDPASMFMRLCPSCGNKRCPKANDHRHECTGSNEPEQPGSAYPAHGGITAAPKGGQDGAT